MLALAAARSRLRSDGSRRSPQSGTRVRSRRLTHRRFQHRPGGVTGRPGLRSSLTIVSVHPTFFFSSPFLGVGSSRRSARVFLRKQHFLLPNRSVHWLVFLTVRRSIVCLPSAWVLVVSALPRGRECQLGADVHDQCRRLRLAQQPRQPRPPPRTRTTPRGGANEEHHNFVRLRSCRGSRLTETVPSATLRARPTGSEPDPTSRTRAAISARRTRRRPTTVRERVSRTALVARAGGVKSGRVHGDRGSAPPCRQHQPQSLDRQRPGHRHRTECGGDGRR